MMPTQEEIDDARETYRQWQPEVPADSFDPPMEADEAIRVMDAAYRTKKARAELVELQYAELSAWVTSPAKMVESWAERLARHEAERKAIQ
jgi:hypothetical protein